MRNTFILLMALAITVCGCESNVRLFGPVNEEQTQVVPQIGTVSSQQLAAYSQVGENPYLVLKNFETSGQEDDFILSRSDGPLDTSKIFHSTSPAATGAGAMGVEFGPEGDYTLTFTTPIRRWKGYNLLLLSVFAPEDRLVGRLAIKDMTGKAYKTSFLLRKFWNPLQIDLKAAGRAIDLGQVSTLSLSFTKIGQKKIYLDDLILVDYHKLLLGRANGPVGTLFAYQNGKEIHLGSNRRFELVFYEGRLTGWYDLETNPSKKKTENLLMPEGFGLGLFQVAENNRLDRIPADQSLVTAHTTLNGRESKRITLTVENYFGEIPGPQPDQTWTWNIYPDGMITVDIAATATARRLGVGVNLAANRDFEAVIGKLRNPAGDAKSRIEYVLFRRMGENPGADLVMMFKPWKLDSLPVQCRLQGTQAVLISEATPGENHLRGMIRLWPTSIDHLGNAETQVRKFLETSNLDLKLKSGSPQGYQPAWGR